MTHSTLTWFSGSIEPKYPESHNFLIAVYKNGTFQVQDFLYLYDLEEGDLFFNFAGDKVDRKDVAYWAYVQKSIDLQHGEGKQSQIPEEK